ncbi:MAG TPA: hypothetical protein VJ011_00605, partial [Steroidobacteraceae bacterium]|nr:hypothetical protein [Steroidobacteraceae bacterium]
GAAAGLQIAQLDATGKVLARRTVTAVPPTRMSGNPRLASSADRALLAWIEPDAARGRNTLAVALLRRP